MNTYPIGFKGTPGDWKVAMGLCQVWGDRDKVTVCLLPEKGRPEMEFDCKLLAASKKMAVALQNLLDIHFTDETDWGSPSQSDELKECISFAKSVLKEAGLNP